MTESSSNKKYVSEELTHFVGRKELTDDDRFELLCEILGLGKLGKGQGNIGIHFPHKLTSNELLVPQMVCFCDIPLDSMGIHTDKYSKFGLAFTKVFMRQNGCNPVYYVSMHSPCTDHRYRQGDHRRRTTWGVFFDEAFKDWVQTVPHTDGRIDAAKLSRIQNLTLWYVFGHVKFFDSTLKEDDPKNYYMEREWRLIGLSTFKLDDVAGVILPRGYVERFKAKFSAYPDERIHKV